MYKENAINHKICTKERGVSIGRGLAREMYFPFKFNVTLTLTLLSYFHILVAIKMILLNWEKKIALSPAQIRMLNYVVLERFRAWNRCSK